MANQQN